MNRHGPDPLLGDLREEPLEYDLERLLAEGCSRDEPVPSWAGRLA